MPEDHLQALPDGHRIDEHEIVRVLGAGGFGITYLAFDHNLQAPVAIKEYFYSGLVTRTGGNKVVPSSTSKAEGFEWGRARFLDEARLLARLDHPNVVRVRRCIEAHNTAYIVMDYVEGESLAAVLEKHGALTPPEWRRWLEPLLDGLQYVHRRDYLHRDVKPANVVIRAEDGAPVLIDFGSARRAAGEKTRHLTAVHTDGYAPIEQYSASSRQGPATDIYGLAAVSYRALTGQPPPAAPDRMLDDTCRPLAEQVGGADRAWLQVLDRGLALRPEDRPETVAAWRAALASEVDAADRPARRGGGLPGIPERPRDVEVSPSSSRLRPSSRRVAYGLAAALALAGLVVTGVVVQRQRPADGQVFRDCAECPEMVVLPAGEFLMGSPSSEEGRSDNEGPQHSVRVGRFALGRHEVTRGEYAAFATSTGRESGRCGGFVIDGDSWDFVNDLSWRSPGFAQTDGHPVVCVSWNDARAYVRWLSERTGESYRLPSESEWEYAARGGTRTSRYWGASSSGQCEHENGADRALERLAYIAAAACDDGYSFTATAGTFPANPFGLSDMLGNVSEWVADCWHDNYLGSPADGSNWTGSSGCLRVLRGGSWNYSPGLLRSAFRYRSDAGYRSNRVGFRVARTLN